MIQKSADSLEHAKQWQTKKPSSPKVNGAVQKRDDSSEQFSLTRFSPTFC